ncbi:hypothetical protein ACOMHN_024759 [Nucella lapillus]
MPSRMMKLVLFYLVILTTLAKSSEGFYAPEQEEDVCAPLLQYGNSYFDECKSLKTEAGNDCEKLKDLMTDPLQPYRSASAELLYAKRCISPTVMLNGAGRSYGDQEEDVCAPLLQYGNSYFDECKSLETEAGNDCEKLKDLMTDPLQPYSSASAELLYAKRCISPTVMLNGAGRSYGYQEEDVCAPLLQYGNSYFDECKSLETEAGNDCEKLKDLMTDPLQPYRSASAELLYAKRCISPTVMLNGAAGNDCEKLKDLMTDPLQPYRSASAELLYAKRCISPTVMLNGAAGNDCEKLKDLMTDPLQPYRSASAELLYAKRCISPTVMLNGAAGNDCEKLKDLMTDPLQPYRSASAELLYAKRCISPTVMLNGAGRSYGDQEEDVCAPLLQYGNSYFDECKSLETEAGNDCEKLKDLMTDPLQPYRSASAELLYAKRCISPTVMLNGAAGNDCEKLKDLMTDPLQPYRSASAELLYAKRCISPTVMLNGAGMSLVYQAGRYENSYFDECKSLETEAGNDCEKLKDLMTDPMQPYRSASAELLYAKRCISPRVMLNGAAGIDCEKLKDLMTDPLQPYRSASAEILYAKRCISLTVMLNGAGMSLVYQAGRYGNSYFDECKSLKTEAGNDCEKLKDLMTDPLQPYRSASAELLYAKRCISPTVMLNGAGRSYGDQEEDVCAPLLQYGNSYFDECKSLETEAGDDCAKLKDLMTDPLQPYRSASAELLYAKRCISPTVMLNGAALRLLSHSTSRLQDDVYKHIMELGILHNSPPSTKRGCRAGRLHRLWHGLPPAPWPCTRSQHHSVPSRNLHPLMVPPFLQPHPDLQSAVGNTPLSSKHPAQLPTTDCLLSIISPMGGQPSDAPALSPPSPLQQGGQSSNAPALSPPSPLPQGGQPIALALSPPSPPPQGGQPSDAPGQHCCCVLVTLL